MTVNKWPPRVALVLTLCLCASGAALGADAPPAPAPLGRPPGTGSTVPPRR